MKTKYTLFRRGEMFYMQDSATGKQTSLRTKDETEAKSLLEARNAAQRQPVLNLHLARAYLTASDPAFVERTWQVVMEQMQSRGKLSTFTANDRASRFRRRCHKAGVTGVTLHCYRYAWAERAKVVGMPERFAQAALGHNSKAIHRAYLWNHYVIGFDYGEIAEEQNLKYDNVRMKIGRCLDEAQSLVS